MNLRGLYNRRGVRFPNADVFVKNPREGAVSALLTSLVSHWRLNEASGPRLDSHDGHDLSDINTVGSAAGKLGDAALLVAANEEALSHVDSAGLSAGNVDFTVGCWVYLTTNAASGVVGKWQTDSQEWLVYFNGTNFGFYVTEDGGAVSASAINLTAISTGTWYYVVGWHDATADTINCLVNNAGLVSTAHATGVYDGSASMYVGRNEEGLTWLDGRVDSLSLWKRVLTGGERTSLYNGGNGLDYPFA